MNSDKLPHGRGKELPDIENQLYAEGFENNNDIFHLFSTYSVSRTVLRALRRRRKTCRAPGSDTRCFTVMISIYPYTYSKDRHYYCPHFPDEETKAHKK